MILMDEDSNESFLYLSPHSIPQYENNLSIECALTSPISTILPSYIMHSSIRPSIHSLFVTHFLSFFLSYLRASYLYLLFLSISINVTAHNGSIAATPSVISSSQPQSSTWGSKISAGDFRDPSFWTITLLYPCMYSILVDVSVKLFALLALLLTNFENHRTQTTFVNRLVLKVSQLL